MGPGGVVNVKLASEVEAEAVLKRAEEGGAFEGLSQRDAELLARTFLPEGFVVWRSRGKVWTVVDAAELQRRVECSLIEALKLAQQRPDVAQALVVEAGWRALCR